MKKEELVNSLVSDFKHSLEALSFNELKQLAKNGEIIIHPPVGRESGGSLLPPVTINYSR